MSEMRHPQEPVEQEAVRTTIVGGRPPGCGKGVGMIPRGIEVLVKKAAVDAEFRRLLLANRAAVAEDIGLILQPAEAMLLGQIPAAQLELIIASTYVEPTKIPTFLGRVAAAMILAISAGASVTMAQNVQIAKGVRNDRPPVTSTAPATAPADDSDGGPAVFGWRAQTPSTQPATAEANAPLERPKIVEERIGARADVPGDVPADIGANKGQRADIPAPKPDPNARPASMPAIDSALLTKLVGQLDSENPDERAAAHQKILDMGKNVVPHLRQLRKSTKLSAEASVRIDAIIEKLGGVSSVAPFNGMDSEVRVVEGTRMQMPPAPPPPVAPQTTQPATRPAAAQAGEQGDVPMRVAGLQAGIAGATASVPVGDANVPKTQPTTREANVVVERPAEVRMSKGAMPDVPPAANVPPVPVKETPATLPAADTALLPKLIAQLDSENADERAAAHKRILDMGKAVVGPLRQVRQGTKLSAEASVRIDAIIEKLGGAAPNNGMDTEIRMQRGVRVDLPPAPPPPIAPQIKQPATQPQQEPGFAGANVPKTQPTTREANVVVERPADVRPTKGATPDLPPTTQEAIVQERPAEVRVDRGERADVPPTPAKEKPATLPAADAALLPKLVAQLDSENADERAAAHQRILDMGKGVVGPLRQVRQGSKLSAEASVRIDAIIEKLAAGQPPQRDPSNMVVAGAVVQPNWQPAPPPAPVPAPATKPASQPAWAPPPPK